MQTPDQWSRQPLVIDDVERIALQVICLVKYGGIGGTATQSEMRLVTQYLRKFAPPKVAIAPPKVAIAPPKVAIAPPKVAIPSIPSIQVKLP